MNKKLSPSEIESQLNVFEGWHYDENAKMILKTFHFKSYLKTIAFVNAIAWLANKENHHPDLEVSFDKCVVKFTTHDEGGVSLKDFDCAMKVNQL